ncbi:hypothetical protein Pcinc_010100 [Petrolisthes cinctipes]|uniref:C2H2-type domain-containing protein n=1 Tax=Petrolisthes cinctipes TaxID=88211 RepID=A0AAE1KUU3_PETCI|nr:hypothetical protein Pcinc_010100 [Petrolisthes cinctipes]
MSNGQSKSEHIFGGHPVLYSKEKQQFQTRMEIQDSWSLLLSLGMEHRGWDDPLFKEGLSVCSPLIKPPLYIDEEDYPTSREEGCQCSEMGCRRSFTTLAELVSHQRACHNHACITCHLTLPSHHLLDLHILEEHDTLFHLMAEKKPMYQCYLETCSEKFNNPTERKNHCIQQHKFPSSYRFDTSQKKLGKKKGKHKAMQTKEQSRMEFDEPEWRKNDMDKDDTETKLQKDGISSKKPISNIPNYFSFGSGVTRGFRGVSHGVRGRAVVSNYQKNSNKNRNYDINMKDIEEALCTK